MFDRKGAKALRAVEDHRRRLTRLIWDVHPPGTPIDRITIVNARLDALLDYLGLTVEHDVGWKVKPTLPRNPGEGL